MSKVIRTQKPSVLPWYAAALVFAVLCAVLPAYKLWALLLALGGAAVMFGAAKKVCPPRVVEHEVPFHTGSGDVDEMLADIQQKLDALHALNEALPDPELSAAMTRMEKAGRSIVETVETSPAKAKQVRRFANYYLPDAVNVLAVRKTRPPGRAGRKCRFDSGRGGAERGFHRHCIRKPAGCTVCR